MSRNERRKLGKGKYSLFFVLKRKGEKLGQLLEGGVGVSRLYYERQPSMFLHRRERFNREEVSDVGVQGENCWNDVLELAMKGWALIHTVGLR